MVATAAAAELRIAARDGFELAATRFDPPVAAAGASRGIVLVVPATGVARRLYQGFAAFLASEGFRVVTWDWRGTGGSRPDSLRGFHATMMDWATLDFGGVLDWARANAGGRPLLAVGHSFGGQALGLLAGAEARRGGDGDTAAPWRGFAGAVTVAAQSGYWRHWPRPQRYWYAAVWHLVVPLSTTLCGYFPSRLLRFGEELPAGVARQWARWCRSPDFLGDWSGHARFAAPLFALSFGDDAYAPPAAVAALHRRYTAASLTTRHLRPHDAGVTRIGHFGFFKPGLPALWREVSAWLATAAAAADAGAEDSR
ncbi:MAG TPA: alpha/beta fold hydrolase [Thermoanaerobaculia bacterium]|nr:alpha/beta fold hydrolase [Thermoanaerobaculia bacterium]